MLIKYERQKRRWQKSVHSVEAQFQLPTSKEGVDKDAMKRVEVNDPAALRYMGIARYNEGNYKSSFAYLLKGAELGDVGAHYQISLLYRDGEGVEKDVKKKVYHLEEAAIGGHLGARYNLGNHECRNSRHDRAAKHYIIAANLGHEAALRGHQAAIDAMKSPQRDEAEAFVALQSTVN
eukprot:scaffold9323_cov73-Skeletonema_marinoi.AAC.3